MTIEFYLHTEMPEDMNERRALFRVARLLHQEYADSLRGHFALIGNIDPQQDRRFNRFSGLTQLDALLLGPRLAAIVEFKNYYDRIVGGERGPWYAYPTARRGLRPARQEVRGGNAANPYQQARKAKEGWVQFLNQEMPGTSWGRLQDFVLFHPWLHEGSDIQIMALDHYWLHFRSVETIVELVQANNTLQGVTLTAAQMQAVAQNALGAQRWVGLERTLTQRIGTLFVELDGVQTGYPLGSYQEVTFGRGVTAGEHIPIESSLVSRYQARVVTQMEAVRLFDMGSKNGTWLDGERVDTIIGRLLPPGAVVLLGGKGPNAVRLWYEPYQTTSFNNVTNTETA